MLRRPFSCGSYEGKSEALGLFRFSAGGLLLRPSFLRSHEMLRTLASVAWKAVTGAKYFLVPSWHTLMTATAW